MAHFVFPDRYMIHCLKEKDVVFSCFIHHHYWAKLLRCCKNWTTFAFRQIPLHLIGLLMSQLCLRLHHSVWSWAESVSVQFSSQPRSNDPCVVLRLALLLFQYVIIKALCVGLTACPSFFLSYLVLIPSRLHTLVSLSCIRTSLFYNFFPSSSTKQMCKPFRAMSWHSRWTIFLFDIPHY